MSTKFFKVTSPFTVPDGKSYVLLADNQLESNSVGSYYIIVNGQASKQFSYGIQDNDKFPFYVTAGDRIETSYNTTVTSRYPEKGVSFVVTEAEGYSIPNNETYQVSDQAEYLRKEGSSTFYRVPFTVTGGISSAELYYSTNSNSRVSDSIYNLTIDEGDSGYINIEMISNNSGYWNELAILIDTPKYNSKKIVLDIEYVLAPTQTISTITYLEGRDDVTFDVANSSSGEVYSWVSTSNNVTEISNVVDGPGVSALSATPTEATTYTLFSSVYSVNKSFSSPGSNNSNEVVMGAKQLSLESWDVAFLSNAEWNAAAVGSVLFSDGQDGMSVKNGEIIEIEVQIDVPVGAAERVVNNVPSSTCIELNGAGIEIIDRPFVQQGCQEGTFVFRVRPVFGQDETELTLTANVNDQLNRLSENVTITLNLNEEESLRIVESEGMNIHPARSDFFRALFSAPEGIKSIKVETTDTIRSLHVTLLDTISAGDTSGVIMGYDTISNSWSYTRYDYNDINLILEDNSGAIVTYPLYR